MFAGPNITQRDKGRAWLTEILNNRKAVGQKVNHEDLFLVVSCAYISQQKEDLVLT